MSPQPRQGPQLLTRAGRSMCLALLAGFLAAPTWPAGPVDARPRPSACAPQPGSVCLGAGRFRVEVDWFGDPRFADAEARGLGADAAWFGSPGGAGLVVQVLDGRRVNGHFWVLAGALSQPSYGLVVTDLETGESRAYTQLQRASGATSDLRAFPAAGSPAAPTSGAGEEQPCAGGAHGLCLGRGRLRVHTGRLHATALADHGGYFWDADPTRPELVVSVVDAAAVDGSSWILYGSPSGAPRALRLTDTQAGASFAIEVAAGDAAVHVLRGAVRGPRVVKVALDRTRSVRARVPVAGATLTARSANGTLFTLVIPKGALLSEETITLTPVAAVGGLPFRPGLVAAVHLEPEGLRLFAAATLRIKPPVAVPRAQETTFAYRGTGQQLFLFPPTMKATGVEMKLLHFSGYGVARGTLAEQTAQLARLPTRAEDRLSQRLQSVISKKRRGGKVAETVVAEDYIDDLNQVMRDVYNVSVKPYLTAVTTDCGLHKRQMPIMLGWSKQAAVLGLAGPGGEFAAAVEAVSDALVKGIANCYDEAFAKCVERNDPTQVTEMLSALRQLAVLGAADLVDESKVERCVRFDLVFQSDVEYRTLTSASNIVAAFRTKLHATIPLRFDGSTGVSGFGPLEWLSATWTGSLPPVDDPTVNIETGQGSTLEVSDLGLDVNVFEGTPPPPRIGLTYDPGSPVFGYSITWHPPDDPPVTVGFPDYEWRSPYYFLHWDETTGGAAGPLVARDWSLVGGSLWARKSYQGSRSTPEVMATETTVMELIHTPSP